MKKGAKECGTAGRPACPPSVWNRPPSNPQKPAVRQRKSPLCHPHKEASNKFPRPPDPSLTNFGTYLSQIPLENPTKPSKSPQKSTLQGLKGGFFARKIQPKSNQIQPSLIFRFSNNPCNLLIINHFEKSKKHVSFLPP
ncbi:hypothetical protein Barb4_04384 [Bacteroidales bacterium Barb4]|nr:hypothetical protein Barb4_04384 [Bacteroidales bacterium Barb4]